MFFRRQDADVVEMKQGLTRRVLATSEGLMLAEFTFKQGAEVPAHSHPPRPGGLRGLGTNEDGNRRQNDRMRSWR